VLDSAVLKQESIVHPASYSSSLIPRPGPQLPILPCPKRLARDEVAVLLGALIHLKAGHFGNARPGIEARLADQEVWVFETRHHARGLVLVEDALLADLRIRGPLWIPGATSVLAVLCIAWRRTGSMQNWALSRN
jgi:hypothetical protein